ncbi:unnamed protein product, partial [Allacma fusca]
TKWNEMAVKIYEYFNSAKKSLLVFGVTADATGLDISKAAFLC